MNRIGKNIRTATKRATQYPAIVVDTHGNRASARLSGTGAIVHNLSVVGGNVDIGDAVQVDYTTSEPAIVAVGKTWATWDDLYRLLGKYQIPIPEDPITEFDKIMLFCHRDSTQYYTFPPTRTGLYDALDTAYLYDEDEYGEYMGFGHWSIRLPPLEIIPNYSSWGYDINFYRPIHVWSEGQMGFRFQGYMAAYGGGTTFENIHFYWDAQQSKGQYPVYNLFLSLIGNYDYDYVMNDGDITVTSGSAYDTKFIGCKFTAYGYDGMSPGQADPGQQYYQYNQYSNVDIYPPDGTNDVNLVFEDCDFYAMSRAPDWNSGEVLEETWLEGDGPGRVHVLFKNCRAHPDMDKPFLVNTDTTSDPNIKSITTSNSQWMGVPDRLNPERIYDGGQWLLDTGLDLSPINHVHGSSGSSGGYDDHAFHVNQEGEY